MSVEIKYKRISDFPSAPADNVEVFARTSTGGNARVRYHITQTTGEDTQALMSQAAITTELIKRDSMISRIRGSTVALGRSIKYGNTTIAAEESITDALERVAQSIEEVASAEIPDGSITEPKLSEDVREKLNHDNGYWFYVDDDVSVAETETQEQTTVYTRSLIY